jgi:4-amino-4-deoxy-L-arabinose transferase-like glycosyltransferase
MPGSTESATTAPTIAKTKVVLNEHGATAKVRNPWLVALFTFITIGIYFVFWYYFVNREMADYGEANKVDIGHSPGMSVVAITIGGLIIVPPFVSIFKTGTRMRLTRRVAERPGGSAGLFLLLWILPIVSIFSGTYLQSQLNGTWERLPAAPL